MLLFELCSPRFEKKSKATKSLMRCEYYKTNAMLAGLALVIIAIIVIIIVVSTQDDTGSDGK